jgi:hypothetical protein
MVLPQQFQLKRVFRFDDGLMVQDLGLIHTSSMADPCAHQSHLLAKTKHTIIQIGNMHGSMAPSVSMEIKKDGQFSELRQAIAHNP